MVAAGRSGGALWRGPRPRRLGREALHRLAVDVRPYPWHRLPRLPRAAAGATGAAPPEVPPDREALALATATKLLGQRPELCWGPLDAGAALEVPLAASILRLLPAHGRGVAYLAIPHGLAAALADRTLGAPDAATPPPAPPDDLSAGALCYLVARVLAALGGELTFDGFAQPEALDAALARRPLLGISVALRVGKAAGQCRLWLPPVAPGARTGTTAPPALRPIFAALPLPLSATAGQACLPLAALRALCLGDVLTLDSWSVRSAGRPLAGTVSVAVGGSQRGVWHCSVEPDGLRIDTIEHRETRTMSKPPTVPAAPEPLPEGTALEQLAGDTPMTVEVQIARFSVPLAQLVALRPGDVLPVGTPVGGEVALTTGGRQIARGELVDIEGTLGVRVTQLPDA